jgi:hypothetical protein
MFPDLPFTVKVAVSIQNKTIGRNGRSLSTVAIGRIF